MAPEDKVSRKRKRRSKQVEVEEKREELQQVEETQTSDKVESEPKAEIKQEVKEKKPVVIPKVTFSAWFEAKVKKRKLKYWQEEALEVFMRKQSLSVLEPEDKYDEAFKRF